MSKWVSSPPSTGVAAPSSGSGDILKVQATDPGLGATKGMWVQTYANGDISIWIEDGT